MHSRRWGYRVDGGGGRGRGGSDCRKQNDLVPCAHRAPKVAEAVIADMEGAAVLGAACRILQQVAEPVGAGAPRRAVFLPYEVALERYELERAWHHRCGRALAAVGLGLRGAHRGPAAALGEEVHAEESVGVPRRRVVLKLQEGHMHVLNPEVVGCGDARERRLDAAARTVGSERREQALRVGWRADRWAGDGLGRVDAPRAAHDSGLTPRGAGIRERGYGWRRRRGRVRRALDCSIFRRKLSEAWMARAQATEPATNGAPQAMRRPALLPHPALMALESTAL